jgi:DNA gyrase/topoisomerase IV subunit A
MNVIVTELEDIKARFNDKRRTEIVPPRPRSTWRT